MFFVLISHISLPHVILNDMLRVSWFVVKAAWSKVILNG